MNDINTKSIRPLTTAIACLGISLVVQGAYVEAGYLTSSSGEVVMTGYKECWNIEDGIEGPIDACGDVIELAAVEELDSDGDGVPDNLDKCPGTPAGSKVDSQGCEIIDNLVLRVTADHFKFDSAELEPGMIKLLDEVIAKVNASPGDEQLKIVGHTDSTGPDSYNQGLSERRTRSVADYLIQQGFPRANLSVNGMGESQPVADNNTREGRAMNRRVEVLTH